MPVRIWISVVRNLGWLAGFLCAACGGGSNAIERGPTRVELTPEGGLVVRHNGVQVLESNVAAMTSNGSDPLRFGQAYASFAVANTTSQVVHERYGYTDFQETIDRFVGLDPIGIRQQGRNLAFDFVQGGGGEIAIGDDGSVQIGWSVPAQLGDRLAMSFACRPGDRFFGMGAQVGIEHRGWRVPVWTSEQGVTKADRGQPPAVFGVTGAFYDSYAPIPFTLLNRPLGIWLNTTRYSEFEFCQDGDRLRIEGRGPRFQLVIFPAETMEETVQAFTAATGRPQPVARWAFAPWLDIFGGPAAVQEALTLARGRHIPASAIWAEDWVGTIQVLGGENLTYNWEEDASRYPDLAAVADACHLQGMRFLVYINPFVPDDTRVFQDLQAAGGVVEDSSGQTLITDFPFGAPPAQFDPTAPGGVGVFQAYMDRAVLAGIDGWMADYGEYLPFNSVLRDGRSGAEAHNLYPLLWAGANRTFWQSRRPDGDFSFFSRSGYTGIAAVADHLWVGDQMTTFDRNDGLGSVIPLYLSGGASGIALTHSDIGGYLSMGSDVRTYELWARWLELEAFGPFMRTHHTSDPAGNLQWHSNEQTLSLFGRYARWHQRLLPYFASVVTEASRSGTPALRPIWWGHDKREDLYGVEDEALSGPDLLLAPVVTAATASRPVKLPDGAWRRWRDFDAPLDPSQTGDQVADAGIEDAVLFVRAGAVLPLLTTDYDSLVPPRSGVTLDPSVSVAPGSIRDLLFVVVGGGAGSGNLSGYGFPEVDWSWDGDAIDQGPLESVSIEGQVLPECTADLQIDCLASGLARLSRTSLTRGTIELTAGGQTGTLEIHGAELTSAMIDLR